MPVRRVEDPEEARRLGWRRQSSLVTYDFRLKPAAVARRGLRPTA